MGGGALDGLNLRQREAAMLGDESALIIAGAGTGKTRVLAARIAWLMSENRARAGEILAVTFTNKAAREMRERVAAMTAVNLRDLWLGTFHGLCARLLRIHSDAAGMRADFQILDSQDQLSLVKRILRERGLDAKRFEPAAIRSYINKCKESAQRAADAATLEDGARGRTFAAVYDDYEKICGKENKADFAELLLRAFELLRGDADLRAHYQRRFRHILIDEFQDTNPLQYRWLTLLRGGGNAFFAVGDDDQSIYAFRGADPRQMEKFIGEFNVADDRVIRLEKNYRSAANILGAANAVIANNSGRLGKTLATDAAAGALLTVFRADSGEEEAARVVAEIRERRENTDGSAAILYRTNAQSRLFERALVQAQIPYRVYGGLRFFERREIKEALAYLRLALNSGDNDAFLRAVNFPPRGLGTRTIEKLQSAAQTAQSSLWQAAQSAAAHSAGLAKFISLIEELRDMRGDLPAIARAAVEKSGLKEHYESRPAERERADNLAELVTAAASFYAPETAADEWPEDAPPLAQFLAAAALEAGDTGDGDEKTAVLLMTAHAAKGLEFDDVFIVGLEEGLFPGAQSLDEGPRALEEERRLMYVALTRAKRALFLCGAQSRQLYGVSEYRNPSRFLDEIPTTLLCFADESFSNPYSAPPPASRPPHPARRIRGDAAANFAIHKPPTSAARFAAAAKKTDLPSSSDNAPRPGRMVAHKKFGKGVIIKTAGEGEDIQYQIAFKNGQTKWLLARIANLRAA